MMAEKIQHLAGTSPHMAAPNHPLRRPPGYHCAPLPPARTLVGQPGSAGHVRARGIHQSVAPVLNRAELIQPCVATAVAAARSPAHFRIRPSATTACPARRPATAPARSRPWRPPKCRARSRAEYSALRRHGRCWHEIVCATTPSHHVALTDKTTTHARRPRWSVMPFIIIFVFHVLSPLLPSPLPPPFA